MLQDNLLNRPLKQKNKSYIIPVGALDYYNNLQKTDLNDLMNCKKKKKIKMNLSTFSNSAFACFPNNESDST